MTRQAYLTKTRLADLRSSLTPQDQQILDLIARFRLVSGNQLTRLFTDGESAGLRGMQRQTRRLVE